ncbi:MAG: hypothetical protein K2K97_09725, partial [Muribaculaceae bacterium]|nr:hypothetical protein [Muribaculaceae bacterium]
SIIADLRQQFGRTFVIVTHDPYMTTIADRVITMADGRIISEETKSAETEKTVEIVEEEAPFANVDPTQFPSLENNC